MSIYNYDIYITIVAVNFNQRWLISQSILNQFPWHLASTFFNYSGAYPKNFVKFEWVFQKLDHLTWVKVTYLKWLLLYPFDMWQTVWHVILTIFGDEIFVWSLEFKHCPGGKGPWLLWQFMDPYDSLKHHFKNLACIQSLWIYQRQILAR